MEFSYKLLMIFAIVPFVILGFAIYVMETTYQNVEKQEIQEIKNLIAVQKQKINSDFEYLIDGVEAYPSLSEWAILEDIGSIVEEEGGIGEFEERTKRDAAKYLISNFGFQSFGITLEDGRMYFLEPFEHQSNLSKMNFSDREWFKGVQDTNSTYISDVFISDASNHPIIVISTPVFSESGTLLGMWGGSLDLEYLTSFFNKVKKENSQILLLDEKNIIIANTEDIDSHEIVKDESIIEIVAKYDDVDYLKEKGNYVFIENIEVNNKNWKIITIISEENLLPHLKTQLQDNYVLIVLMSMFIIVAEYLLFNFFRKNFQLNLSIKENRKRLIKQERLAAIGELASRVAHDIRNPLSNIRMSIQLIRHKPPETQISDKEINEKLEIASKNIDRISHQVNDVLDYVKERKLTREKISIKKFLDEAIQSLYIPKNIKITSSKSDIQMLADPIQMQIVFNNILINAIQAIGKEQGGIKVEVKEELNYTIIKFENSGPPIPDEILPNIFESMITSKEIGTGLGLASSKRIIEKHGGTIVAKNNPTTFIVKIPKSKEN